jgi:hypothetical protein
MTPPPRPTTAIIGALSALALVTWLDVITGVQLSVFVLYVVPVVSATWFLGLGGGLWLSLLSVLAHRWADLPAKTAETNLWIIGEKGLASFLLLGFIAFSFHTFKRGRKIDRERIEQLEALVRLCPVCNRVHLINGRWQSLEACLAERPVLPPAQRLCPECQAQRAPEEDGM